MEGIKKVAFLTLGCKTNQYETNGMMQKFIEAGYKVCDLQDYSDIYVVNTCTVTNIADRKSRQSIRRIKEKNNTIVVAVRMLCTGCKRTTRKYARNRYCFRKQRKKRYCRIC